MRLWPGPSFAEGDSERRLARSFWCFTFSFFEEVAIMPQGTIKKLIMDKGFGFIQGERGELFFHHSALDGVAIEELREGQKVEFEEGRGPEGSPRRERQGHCLSVDSRRESATARPPENDNSGGLSRAPFFPIGDEPLTQRN